LSQLAELSDGKPGDEVVLGIAAPRDPLARKAIGPGRDLGRYWLKWSDKWWVPPSAAVVEGEDAEAAPAILVRWDRERLYAAWDETGLVPVGAVVRLVPRLGLSTDPRLLVALAALPIRLPVRGASGAWITALDGIDRANQTIRRAIERLGSIDRIAEEAAVRRVSLRDATGTLLSHRVPPVLEVAGPLVREGNEVRVGDDMVLTARSPEVARLLLKLLETEVRRLVGHSGVEIERLFQVPRTEPEAKLLLAVLDRLHAEIDDAVARRAGWESELEDRALALYEVTPEDVRILTGPSGTDA
jgi:hypothetical protein